MVYNGNPKSEINIPYEFNQRYHTLKSFAIEQWGKLDSVSCNLFLLNVDVSCCSYRDVSTPNSSLQSPASFSLESPRSSFHESPSPCLSFNFDRRSPPTTEELSEFLQVKYFTAEIFFFIIDNKNNLNNSFLYFCVKLFFEIF